MKKTLARKWVKALRSGKYEQGFGSIKCADNKFCCLGVLCEIEPNATSVNNKSLAHSDMVGLSTSTGLITNDFTSGPVTLAGLNDHGIKQIGSLNFNEIADVIQIEYIEGL